MRFRNLTTALLPLAAVVCGAIPAVANDSEAGVALGGLTLLKSENISMDSEDLYISSRQVRVKYRFTNRGSKDVDTLIAFPLPEQRINRRFDDEDAPDVDPNELNFKTTVNGKPSPLSLKVVAKLNDVPVNDALEQRGLPLTWDDRELFFKKIDALDPAKIDSLIADGFLLRNEQNEVVPAWTVTRNITRNQTFPAGKTVQVSHSYTPSVGGSVGGGLTSDDPEAIAYYRKTYCVNKDFVASTKRKSTKGGYGEAYVDYVLSSGANWKGPIKDFRLVVDKENEANLVSFCLTGIKKISPTQFEVRKKNFEPKKDLSILLVGFGKGS